MLKCFLINIWSLEGTEAVTWGCSIKSVFKNCAKFTGKYYCRSLILNKVAEQNPATLLQREAGAVVPVNFARFLNICSVEHLPVVVSECEWNIGWNPCISYPCVLDWWRMALRQISIYMKRVRKKTNVYRVSISKQIIITALCSSYTQTRKFILKPYSNQK